MARDLDQEYEQLATKRALRIGRSALAIGLYMDEDTPRGFRIKEVRFKDQSTDGYGILAVIKVHKDGEDLVGFAGGANLAETLIVMAKKLQAGRLKLREDRPFGE